VLQVKLDSWPMVVTEVSGKLADSDLDILRTTNEGALRRGGRFISLVDVSQMTEVPTAVQRQTYAAWRKAHFEELRTRVIAVAFVVGDRPLLQGGLTALSWLAKHPSPESFFVEREDAIMWLRARLMADRNEQKRWSWTSKARNSKPPKG
jgi:hypothetical protein